MYNKKDIMGNYVIPFWIVLCTVFVVLAILIWLAVVKSRDNHAIEIGCTGVQYLMEQYLERCLQKTVYTLLKYENFKTSKGLDIRLSIEKENLVRETSISLSKALVRFARGKQVIEQLLQELRQPVEKIDIFVFPDVLIMNAKNHFYTNLLSKASFIVYNQKDAHFSSYSNDQSKEYLNTLWNKITKPKLKDFLESDFESKNQTRENIVYNL